MSSRQKDVFPAWKRGRDGGRGVAARGCKKITFWTRSNQCVSLLGCFEEARYMVGTGKAASQAGRPDSGVCRATFHPGSTTTGFSWPAATSSLFLSGLLCGTSLCLIPLLVDTSVQRVDTFKGLSPSTDLWRLPVDVSFQSNIEGLAPGVLLRISLALYSQEPCTQTSVSNLSHGRTPDSIIRYSGWSCRGQTSVPSTHNNGLRRSITPVPGTPTAFSAPGALHPCAQTSVQAHTRIYLIKNKFNLKKWKCFCHCKIPGDLCKRAQLFHGPCQVVEVSTWPGGAQTKPALVIFLKSTLQGDGP